MKRVFLILFSILFGAITSNACQCRNMTFSQEIASVNQIFIGTVLKKEPVAKEDVYYLFSISEIFKGDKYDTIMIRTGFGGPDCGMEFEIGKVYLVFSNFNRTTGCYRNSQVNPGSDLGILKYFFQPGLSNSIFKTTEPILSDTEAEYFNLELLRQRNDFDFSKKKVAFYLNGTLMDKQQYFKAWGGKVVLTNLIIFTEEEKQMVNSYDAIIISGRKGQNKGYRKRLIKKLAQG